MARWSGGNGADLVWVAACEAAGGGSEALASAVAASIRELNKEMHWHLLIDGPRTLNGVILEYLEEIPQPNISVRLAGYPIEILEVENNMVKMARIMPHLYRNESGYED